MLMVFIIRCMVVYCDTVRLMIFPEVLIELELHVRYRSRIRNLPLSRMTPLNPVF